MDIDTVSAERSFLESVYEQSREPDWITRILYGIEGCEEPDIQEIKQVSMDYAATQLRVCLDN